MNTKGIEFNFVWLFSIIVGAVILMIAIFTTTQLVDTSRNEINTKTAAQLGILLHPIETNLEDSKYATISFPQETRVFNTCRTTGTFGRQIISTAVKSGIGEAWNEPGVENTFFNKYLFSEASEQGEELHVFVKPFDFPYKVADLVFATTQDYCFVTAPNDVIDDIEGIQPAHITLAPDSASCPAQTTIVCFAEGDQCDINVDLTAKQVTKDGTTVSYEGSLLYGAIFASPDIYECQVTRLSQRTGELALVYASKSDFLSANGCGGIANELRTFATTSQINTSAHLGIVQNEAELIRRIHDNLICPLF